MSSLGDLTVGTSVYMNVGGVRTEFLVVQHGQPTQYYGAACAGATWLLMKNIYIKKAWDDAGSTDYSLSSIHTYLNGEFLQLLDEDIRNITVEGKVMYRTGTSGTTLKNGENGLPVRVFLISYNEVGGSNVSSAVGLGALLPYFSGSNSKIAQYNGAALHWWLRSPTSTTKITALANGGGTRVDDPTTATNGIRPCIFVNSTARIDESGNVTPGTSINGFVNIGGTYKELSAGYVNIGGAWKELTSGYKNIGGSWTE